MIHLCCCLARKRPHCRSQTKTRTACSLAILMNFGPVKQTVWVQPFFETNNNKSSAFGHRVRVPTGRYLQRKTSVRIPLTCNAAVPIGAANGTSLGGRYVAKILKEDSILCHLVYSQSFRDIYCRKVAISVKPHLDFLDHQHLGSAVLCQLDPFWMDSSLEITQICSNPYYSAKFSERIYLPLIIPNIFLN